MLATSYTKRSWRWRYPARHQEAISGRMFDGEQERRLMFHGCLSAAMIVLQQLEAWDPW